MADPVHPTMTTRGPLHVCTVATEAQLPSVRVLSDSLRARHPDAELTVLRLERGSGNDDGESNDDGEPFRTLSPDALGLPEGLFAQLATACTAPELAAAMTPRLVRLLIEQGAPVVIEIGAEGEVFGQLDELIDRARESGVVLVARGDDAVRDDGLEPDAEQYRAAGPFTAELVAVSADAMPFLDWWTERQTNAALSRGGLAGAGSWTAEAPAAFPVHALRDPRYASAWNLHPGELRETAAGYEVAGRPLRWFDFSGYSPDEPQLLSNRFRRPRVRLGDDAALARLCDEHSARLVNAGHGRGRARYRYDALPDGRAIDTRMRRLYVDGLRDAAEDGAPEPPSPFGPSGAEAFAAWLDESVEPPSDPVVSRYLARVREEEPVLRQLFPSIAGEGAEAYLGALRDERNPYRLAGWMIPTEEHVVDLMWRRWRSRPSAPRPCGVNVVGYVTAVLGVGHVARVFSSLLGEGGVPTAVVANHQTMSQKSVAFDTRRAGDAPYDVNLVCVNADHTAQLAEQVGPEFFAGRRTIGVWAWEVEDFPPESVSAFDLVDEVWVGSDFEYEAIAPVAPKPVRKHPPPVVVPSVPDGVSRPRVGLPEDRFVFLFVYDFLSTAERKNPVGLIEAYTRAFGPDDGAALVLKSINGDKRIDELERVRRAAAGRPDVIVRDEYLSSELHAALLGHCDAYVSLHRTEGFGLDLAAAMGLGKPVIATGYSGNLEYMDHDTAYLVDYELVPVGPGNDPYPPESRWASPNLDHAAELMRRVVERPDEARERGCKAAASVETRFSVETRSAELARMIDEARARPARQGSWRRAFTERWRAERHQDEHLPYGRFWLPDGTPLDRTLRRLLTAPVGERAPDPELDLDGAYRWLNERVFPAAAPVVSRYLYELWSDRPDLQSNFPTLDPDPRPYLQWLIEHGHDDTDIPYQLLPTPDDLRRLTHYEERRARMARVTGAIRAAGQRAADLVIRR